MKSWVNNCEKKIAEAVRRKRNKKSYIFNNTLYRNSSIALADAGHFLV